MKKAFFTIITIFMLIATIHAQQTIVVQRSGIFTDLAEAASALVTIPAVVVNGFVQGTVEAVCETVAGTTTNVIVPAPAVISASAVTSPSVVIMPAPVAVSSSTSASIIVAPATIPSTTSITTVYKNGTSVTVTRPVSSYELGNTVLYPVPPENRVGSSPFVNPYVYRFR